MKPLWTMTLAYAAVNIPGGGRNFPVMFTGVTGDGTLTIAVRTDSDVADAVGHGLASSVTSPTITFDHTAPTAAGALVTPSPTTSDTVVFTVSFSEPVGTSFNDTTVSVAGTLAGTAAITGTDPNYTVTVTLAAPDADGTVDIAMPDGVVTDLAGNPCAGGSSTLCTVHNWPGFAAQPQDAQGYTGEPHTLLVQVAEDGIPTTYQWKFDNGTTVVDGPAAAQWALPSLALSQSGHYWCEVSFDGVAHESGHARVLVATPVTITTHPANLTVAPGGTATFTVAATGGYPPLRYQWKKGADNLPGSPDAPEFSINNVTAADAGDYSVEVYDSHTYGTASAAATLTVSAGLPVAGLGGLALLAAALGAASIRRRK